MAKYLVIVESPAKVKTIKKFLGSNYDVQASNGHVRDFPKSQFGIDVENDFEPKYITIRGKGELLSNLRKAAKKADKIYLATDLKLVYSCLDLQPKSVEFLIQKTGLSPEKVGGLLLELKISGLAREIGRHYYVKTT